jgi:hypothetical protein
MGGQNDGYEEFVAMTASRMTLKGHTAREKCLMNQVSTEIQGEGGRVSQLL